MKKLIIPAAAIAIALFASSFTTITRQHKKDVDLNWFKIAPGYGLSDQILSADATFINRGAAPTNDEGCDSGEDLCVAGFADNQVSSQHLMGNTQTTTNVDATQPEQ